MSRSGSNKTTGATSRSSIDNGQDYRIANIYQRLDEKAREDSLVEISWSTTRRPDVAVPPNRCPMNWAMPGHRHRPREKCSNRARDSLPRR